MNRLSRQAIEQVLLSELSSLGRSGQLASFEEQLRPMFMALPKNAQGNIEPAAVRYALHRFFVSKRGWYVKGLLPGSSAWNSSSSPSLVIQDRVPEYIESVFERQLHGQGLGLHELAAFAATMEDLVHAEAVGILTSIYNMMKLPMDTDIPGEMTDAVVRTYLAAYLIGPNETESILTSALGWEEEVKAIYPAWPDVAMWAQDLQLTLKTNLQRTRSPFSAAMLDPAEVVKEIGHRFGTFQDQECRALKETLLDMEYKGSGRVLLSDFYRVGLESDWQFSESVEYLRMLGALDESDERRPSIVIPNYLASQSNCLASSSFYSVCCLDECEGLIGGIEAEVEAPSAEPAQLAQLVARLPSDSVDAPRNLSSALLLRLEQIAQLNSGRVPLHGRLFAQWMHHAYPRECPFPHESGTTTPMTPEEYLAHKGEEGLASLEDMGRHAAANHSAHASEDLLLPWTENEELVVGMAMQASEASVGWPRRGLLLLALAGAAIASSSRWRSMFASEAKLPVYNF